MATLDSTFKSLLEGHDLAQLDRHEGAIYALCRDWRLRYFNDGWRQFASNNGGEPALSQAWPLGAAIFEAFSPLPLRKFFEFHYRQCLREARVWSHDYECSSASSFRRFRQFVYPVRGDGVLVVNSKLIERAHDAPPVRNAMSADYRDSAGLVHQCAHCRRIRSAHNHDNWDWVPAWVSHMPPRCSHGLCPTCLVFYYLKPGVASS